MSIRVCMSISLKIQFWRHLFRSRSSLLRRTLLEGIGWCERTTHLCPVTASPSLGDDRVSFENFPTWTLVNQTFAKSLTIFLDQAVHLRHTYIWFLFNFFSPQCAEYVDVKNLTLIFNVTNNFANGFLTNVHRSRVVDSPHESHDK